MLIFPAIDLVQGKAVRLYKGDYAAMTVYSEDPSAVAEDFVSCGVGHIHIVDLEGAKSGGTPNFETVCAIRERSGAFCEIGGGIRTMETAERYLSAGLDRVILGTAAVTDEGFAREAVQEYGGRIAVGADLRDGYIAVKGWLEQSETDVYTFFEKMQRIGVETVICTDISRDGAMQGTNRALYRELSARFGMNITASGGVSTLEDVQSLREMELYAAIIGKAYYTGAIDLKKAIEVAE